MQINLKLIIYISILYSSVFSKDLYMTRSGNIDFFSSTPIEDIKAINNQVSCVLNKDNGQFAFQVPIKAFTFKNALMQEHFNESYLESDIYPKAIFKGEITDWDDIQLSKDSLKILIEGDLTIHGIKNKIKQSGKIWVSSGIIHGDLFVDIKVLNDHLKDI